MHDRVRRVLPTLVLQTTVEVAALILQIAVAVQIPVVFQPVQRRSRLRLQLDYQVGVTRPTFVLVEQDQKQRCGVRRSVVRRLWPVLEVAEFTESQLVQDLARLRVAEVVPHLRLPPGRYL